MTPEDVVAEVIRYTGAKRERFFGHRRDKYTSDARAVAVVALRLRFALGLQDLARLTGCHHHTSALYHLRRGRQTPDILDVAERVLAGMGWLGPTGGDADPEEVMA